MRFETVNLGIPGPGGTPGAPGSPGKSAYEIAVDNGFEGTEEEWLESLAGAPGPTNPSFHYTLVAAKAADLSGIDAVTTSGFSTIGDGGEGVYKVQDTEPAPIGSKLHHFNIGGRWIVLAGDRINLKAMGASLLASDDQTDYLQDAVDAHKPVFIPAGTVTISQSILYSPYLNIEGIGGTTVIGADPHTPSIIAGNIGAPLIHRREILIIDDDYPNAPTIVGSLSAGTGSKFGLRNIMLSNLAEKTPKVGVTNGTVPSCIQVWNSVCPVPIENVIFRFRHRGAEMLQPFSANLVNCSFVGDWYVYHDVLTEDYKDAVALMLFQARAFNCDFAACGTGVRMWGSASLYGGRIEVCGQAIHVGARAISQDANNGTVALSQGAIEGITLEANHQGIEIQSMNNSRIANIGNYSSANGPATRAAPYDGFGDVGLTVIQGNAGSIIEGLGFNGYYMKYATDIRSGYVGQLRGINAVNSVVPGTSVTRPVGIGKTNLMNRDSSTLRGQRGIFDIDVYDKIPAVLSNGDQYVSHMGNLRLSALVPPDNIKSPIYGRNLCGTLLVPVDATTATYTFLTNWGEGSAGFGAVTATAQVGSSLAPGTYHYATTYLGQRGETGISSFTVDGVCYKTVTIAADQKAHCTFTARDAPLNRLRRRIYRGTAFGVFDGFFELNGTDNVFDDDGTRAFDGLSYPPGASNEVPTQVELDANYFVQVQPTWATTWHVPVASKLTTAFTVTFGTANTTGSIQTVGWLMYRP